MRPLPLLLLLLAAPLAWAAPPGVTVSWTPARVVLGQDTRVTVEVRVPAGSGPVRGAASSGTFARERMEGGEVRAFEWTPPSVRYPLVAVLTFWLEGGTDASEAKPLDQAVVRIPLLGKTQLDVSTAAGASVVVEVGGTRFGPVQADDSGRARVPVEVPPGVRSASVLATRETLRTRATIPLDPPQEVPLVAALTPSPLPLREGGWLLVAGEEGLRADALELTVEGATLSDEAGRRAGEPTPTADEATRSGSEDHRSGKPMLSATGAALSAVEGAPLRYRIRPAQDATAVTVTVRRKGYEDQARTVAEVTHVPVVVPPPAPVPRPETPTPAPTVTGPWRPSVFVLAGGAIASGANTGPAGAVGVSLSPPWWGGRFAAELEAGLRSATFDGRVDSLGAVRSRVLAVPVLASVRGVIFQRAAFSLHGRAGGGVLPFQHRLLSDFQEDLKESKVAGMGFLSVQGAYRLGRWSALAEVRGSWAPARTPWLDAQLGGLSGLLGVRFEP
ncbi:hypothetical protein [Pyxidicoccus caerfyrddinensis]|uniref:hypothetical protein n=1 Tax=Pyxidicoccus caerfyrddinensis TaxID=2709663 RepID=UPI001F07FC85|nr:hypothetical protein [Pyxidicoccus caerfyrddinensis]